MIPCADYTLWASHAENVSCDHAKIPIPHIFVRIPTSNILLGVPQLYFHHGTLNFQPKPVLNQFCTLVLAERKSIEGRLLSHCKLLTYHQDVGPPGSRVGFAACIFVCSGGLLWRAPTPLLQLRMIHAPCLGRRVPNA